MTDRWVPWDILEEFRENGSLCNIFSSLATSGVIENSFGKSVDKYALHLTTLGQKLLNTGTCICYIFTEYIC